MRLTDITSSGSFLRIIELFPPGLPMPQISNNPDKLDLTLRFDRLVENVQKLESLADGFSLPELMDEQRIHLNSVAVASELKRKTGNTIIPTLTLRDSNRQNLLGSIAYAIYSGIENILVVRGDPYPVSKNSAPKNVYDLGRVSDLVSLVRRLEDNLSSDSKLCIMSPINLTRSADPGYMETIRSRESAGVDIFVAESFFEDIDSYFSRLDSIRNSRIKDPIIHSIFPLKNYEDGIACKEKFGWSITKEELAGLKTQGSEYGLEMARKRYHALIDRAEKAHGASISTRGNSELARQITS